MSWDMTIRLTDTNDSQNKINLFINSNENINTKKKTNTDVSKFQNFLETKAGVKEQIENINPRDLAKYLSLYIIEVKKPDGSSYEPDTISSWLHSIKRHLNDKNTGLI